MDRWGNNDCTFSCYWSLQVICCLSTSFLSGRVFFSRVIHLQVYSFMASNLVLWLLGQKDRMICLTVSFWDVGTYLMFGRVQADFFLPSTNEETSRFGLMSLRSYVMWLPKRLSGSRNWLASRDVVATQTCILWNIPFMPMSSGLLHCPLYQSPLLHLMYVSHNFIFFCFSRDILWLIEHIIQILWKSSCLASHIDLNQCLNQLNKVPGHYGCLMLFL